jgi:transposase
MYYVGLDLHTRTSTVCILDGHGKHVKTFTIRGRWPKVLERLATLPRPFAICYEASCGYGWMHDRLAKLAPRVVVAHPGQLRLIFRSKRKNDRVDAQKLAKLLFLDEVPAVHVPTLDARRWRELIEQRRATVDKRTRVKNGLRALLRAQAIAKPRGAGRWWTNKANAWLRQLSLDDDDLALRRDLLMIELDQLDSIVARLTKRLDQIAATHPGVTLLQSIPGVGPRTAEAVLAYVDRIDRFARNRQVGSYFGLAPSHDHSADTRRDGHITRQGPGTVRKLLVEAAWQAQRLDPSVKTFFQRVTAGKKERRKIAIVATAHHLLRCMAAMLRSGECWRAAT